MNKHVPASKVTERMLLRPEGATMDEIVAATGGPQYNVLRRLKGKGYAVRSIKEGSRTRYFASQSEIQSFDVEVSPKGQVTIPKEIREVIAAREGGKVRFTVDSAGRVLLQGGAPRLADLRGILPRPKRALTIREMDEAARRAVAGRFPIANRKPR